MSYRQGLIVLFLCGMLSGLIAQDLDNLKKGEWFKVGGGANLSTVFYNANGIDPRRDPFYWQLQANLNFNVAGIAIPFSATFSQQERSYTQPFNQVGISPKYKAITAHLGYRTMSFSPYTLGGKVFLGGGLEIAPKDFWIQGKILYGRFARAVQEGGNDGIVAGIAAYERWGYGAQVRLGRDAHFVTLNAFRGRDNENSITVDSLNSHITPGENLVWSAYTKHKFGQRVTFDVEYSSSAFTRDVRNDQVIFENFSYTNNLGKLFTPNATTHYDRAIIGNIMYAHNKFNVKLSYKRVDPEYESMGTPFLNNDIENLTAGVSWKMLKDQLNITTTGGLQRNNIDDSKATRETRLAAGLNTSYTFKKKLNLGLNYSNYTSSVRQVQFIELDSIDYFQVSHNISFRANYKLASDKKTNQDIMYTTNYQLATASEGGNTSIINNNLGYKLMLKTIGLSGMVSFNYNKSIFEGLETDSYGPTLSLAKNLLKKKMSLRFTYNSLFRDAAGVRQNIIGNYRFITRYNINKYHSLSLQASLLDRRTFTGNQASFVERTLTLQYSARF